MHCKKKKKKKMQLQQSSGPASILPERPYILQFIILYPWYIRLLYLLQ